MTQSNPKLIIALACAALSIAGCGTSNPPTYPVSGTVKYSDGKPLAGGTIEFELQGTKIPMTARGIIDSSGHYELGTFDISDGAVAGTYTIRIFASSTISNEWERPDRIQKSTLHPKYGDLEKSGLSKQVTEGDNTFDLEVEYAPVKG